MALYIERTNVPRGSLTAGALGVKPLDKCAIILPGNCLLCKIDPDGETGPHFAGGSVFPIAASIRSRGQMDKYLQSKEKGTNWLMACSLQMVP